MCGTYLLSHFLHTRVPHARIYIVYHSMNVCDLGIRERERESLSVLLLLRALQLIRCRRRCRSRFCQMTFDGRERERAAVCVSVCLLKVSACCTYVEGGLPGEKKIKLALLLFCKNFCRYIL